ncbi:hypothetical protein SEUCBS140593_006645 [Sporothrix eucalyptigena]|uniref:Endo-polygalacturonase n=1 Tax=Sporothrix eucalyptigena TaxID=1812306 RepID=A0ABP0C746_9PEZI
MLQAALFYLSALCYAGSAAAAAVAKSHESATIVAYSLPTEVTRGSTFDVKVAAAGDDHYTNVETFITNVGKVNTSNGDSTFYTPSVATFDFGGGSVDVTITFNSSMRIGSVQVRPYSYGIEATVDEKASTIKLTLAEPRNIVVQVNEDVWQNVLHLFSNDIETDVPSPDDPDVLYFAPGYHTSSTGFTNVTSGQTVYLAGGAAVSTTFSFVNVTNATMRGRGLVYKPTKAGGVLIVSSEDITVQDLIFVNPDNGYTLTAGMASGVTVRNIRTFSDGSWGDGMDYFCCSNVLVDGVFLRTSDDCVAIYNHRYDYYGNSTNITVQNSALWADEAHPVNMGTHGNALDPETISGVTLRNIDVLFHREMQQLYQGCVALNAGDENLIRDVLVDGYRIEQIVYGQLVNLRVMNNSMYNTAPGRGIQNITIKDLSFNGSEPDTSIFVGFSPERSISGVTFQNLVVNGTQIYDDMPKASWYLTSDYVHAFVNEFVTDLVFNR